MCCASEKREERERGTRAGERGQTENDRDTGKWMDSRRSAVRATAEFYCLYVGRRDKKKHRKKTHLGRDLALDAVELQDVRGGVGAVGVGERGHGLVGGREDGERAAVDLAGQAVLLDGVRERREAGGARGVHQIRSADHGGAAAGLGRLAADGLKARARGDGLGESEGGHVERGGEW